MPAGFWLGYFTALFVFLFYNISLSIEFLLKEKHKRKKECS